MAIFHFVRVGLFGQVGRFPSAEGTRYPRRCRVVCRTRRGLEVGEVLATEEVRDTPLIPPEPPSYGSPDGGSASHWGSASDLGIADGTLLRQLTVEDQLLLARLDRHRDAAFRSCEELLRTRGLSAVLMEVEHLFDGRGLYFYFLGEATAELDGLTEELATAYDAEVQFHRFAATLTDGCGPGCGTAEAAGNGCGSGGCASCSIAAACSPRPPPPAESHPA